MRERGERERERGIIIQLSVLCRAELTRTEADFLLLTHPSATFPCRKREEEEGKEGEAGWMEREGNTHARQIIQNYSTGIYMLLLLDYSCDNKSQKNKQNLKRNLFSSFTHFYVV